MKLSIVEAVANALAVEMGQDDRVVVLGEDVGKDGGVFRATEGLFEKYGPKRVIDTPLAESGIVGAAIGMAVYGLRPVAEIQFDGFMYYAFHQLESHAARIRNRSRGRYTCPLVVRAPYGGGIKALEHHSEANEAYFAHTPGLKVVIPSTPYDTKGLLISAIRDPDPVIFLEPKRIYRAFKEEVPEEAYTVPIGQAKTLREGTDVTLITWGAMTRPTMDVAEEIAKRGVNAEVIDLRTISPMDEDAIIRSVKKTGRCVVVHEAKPTCGMGAEIAARIGEKALVHLAAPVQRVSAFDVVFPLFRLEDYYLPGKQRILNAIDKVMSF
jgi:pyruvate dehydrogenase E1 component beta subunit